MFGFRGRKEQVKSRLAEFESLPGMLAAAQLDLEKERSAKAALEKERDELSDEIECMVCIECMYEIVGTHERRLCV